MIPSFPSDITLGQITVTIVNGTEPPDTPAVAETPEASPPPVSPAPPEGA